MICLAKCKAMYSYTVSCYIKAALKPFTKHPDLFTKRLLLNDLFTKRLAFILITVITDSGRTAGGSAGCPTPVESVVDLYYSYTYAAKPYAN